MAAEVRRKVGRVERARERRAVEQVHETDEKLERGRSLVTALLGTRRHRAGGVERPGLRPPPRRLRPAVRLHAAAPRRRPRRRVRGRRDPAGDRPARSGAGADHGPTYARPRSVDHLLTDFGTTCRGRKRRRPRRRPDKPFPKVVGRRGAPQAGHGWAPTLPPLAGYQMTSEQTPVMWPLIAGDGLPPTGAPMGFDVLSGGSFYCDPMGWVNDDSIPVTNPNVFIFGKPGRGKSALVKAFMLRMIRFGYRSLVLGDVKDEYEDISRALGVEPYRIGPGLPGRINPLDVGPLALDWEKQDRAETARRGAIIFNRWLALIRGLVGSQQVPFTPTEARVITQVLRDLTGWTAGQTTSGAGRRSRWSGRRWTTRAKRWWKLAATTPGRTSSTAPGRCATPWAPCARASSRGSSTPPRRSSRTGAPRSRRCRSTRCTPPATRPPSASP